MYVKSRISPNNSKYFAYIFFISFQQEKQEEEDTIILLSKEEKDKQAVIDYFKSFDIVKDDTLLIKRSKLYFEKYRVTLKSKNGLGLLESPNPSTNTTFLICHPKNQEIIGEYKKWIEDINGKLPKFPHKFQVVLIDSNCGCIGYHMFKTPPEITRICNGPPIMVRCDGKIFGYTLFFMKSPKKLWQKLRRDFVKHLPRTLKDMQNLTWPIACFVFFGFICPFIYAVAILLGLLI